MSSSRVDLTSLSYKQLRTLAKEYEIPQYSRMTKSRLLDMLEIEINGVNYDDVNNLDTSNIIDNIKTKDIDSDRNINFRQQYNRDESVMDEPYSFLNEYNLFPTPLPDNESYANENFSDFEARIEHYFWVQQGEHDVSPWRCLVKLDDGRYAYYEAGCDYTGFDCQGYMKVWVSENYSKLINLAMNEEAYNSYLADTEDLEQIISTSDKC